MADFGDWTHLRTVVRIESETRTRKGDLVASDNRYFLSSLPRESLADAQWLRVVRGFRVPRRREPIVHPLSIFEGDF